MKALSFTIQKLWPWQKFLQINKWTNRQAKNYLAPIYRCWGIKNFVGKGENAGNQHFLLFQQIFKRRYCLRIIKFKIVLLNVNRIGIQPFPKQLILDSSKLKEFADGNFNLIKMAENTVGKGEIAHKKQFLLFSQCFQKTCTADM